MSEIKPDSWRYKVNAYGSEYWKYTEDIDRVLNGLEDIEHAEITDIQPLYDSETVAQILNKENDVEQIDVDYKIPKLEALSDHNAEEYYD